MNTEIKINLSEVVNKPLPQVYLSDSQMAKRYGVSRQTIRRWSNQDPNFPKPCRFSTCCTRWKLQELENWEAKS